jgi:hypothetical protein
MVIIAHRSCWLRWLGRVTFIRAIVVILLCNCITGTAQSNILHAADMKATTEVTDQFRELMSDLVPAGQAARLRLSECILSMYYNIDPAYRELEELQHLVAISAAMQLPDDETIVNMALVTVLHSAKNIISLSRSQINSIAGRCGNDGLVIDRERESLRLFSKATDIILTLESKFPQPR